MNFEINECWNCKSKNLFKTDDSFIICLDCQEYYEVQHKRIDNLSFWIYKRQYVKKCRKQENNEGKVK